MKRNVLLLLLADSVFYACASKIDTGPGSFLPDDDFANVRFDKQFQYKKA